jgi:hypothetical protein
MPVNEEYPTKAAVSVTAAPMDVIVAAALSRSICA